MRKVLSFWHTGLGRVSQKCDLSGFFPVTLCPWPCFHQPVASVLCTSQALVLSHHGWESRRWGGKLCSELRAGISKFFWSASNRALAWYRQVLSPTGFSFNLSDVLHCMKGGEWSMASALKEWKSPIPKRGCFCSGSVSVLFLNFRFSLLGGI